MFNVGPTEIIVILVLALLVFGPKKLPEIGKSLGQGLREIKKASRDVMSTLDGVDEEPEHTKETAHNVTDSNRHGT